MSKSKTPIADSYKHCHPDVLKERYEELKSLEILNYHTKEESPSKAIEVLELLDKLVTSKVNEREKSIILEHKTCLDYEFLSKTKELEATHEAKRKSLDKEYKDKFDKLTKELLETRSSNATLIHQVNKNHKEYISDFIDMLIENSSISNNIEIETMGEGLFSKGNKVKFKSKHFLEAFKEIVHHRCYI